MAAEPLGYLIEIFGSKAALARALGVNASLITRWLRRPEDDPRGLGRSGRLPPQYNARLIEAAAAAGISRAEVAPYLDDDLCECCGQPKPKVRA